MKLLVFLNALGLGGTEKAAGRWAWGLQARGHAVTVLALADGPRRAELEAHGVPVKILHPEVSAITAGLRHLAPEVIHAHSESFLGEALEQLPQKIPVVLTDVFGLIHPGRKAPWITTQLFISWTSCVQAARRSYQRLDDHFFPHASVAVYPLDPMEPASTAEITEFRRQIGVAEDEILFGRLSRPEPNKWTDLAVEAFRRALRRAPNIKLLLREPPPQVTAQLRAAPDADRFVILSATAEAEELRRTLSALDVVLHTSSMGESFGYGIAEPMNLGKPVITHTLPWRDQTQLELVRHGECGFIGGTPAALADMIVKLANDPGLRQTMGRQAQQHIRTLADPEVSLNRLETLLRAALKQHPNPLAAGDLVKARDTAQYLDRHQFGHSWLEQLALRPFYYRVRFHQLRKKFN
jgi:glycosyltransferase involved in cell wall biosynthesis